jgi:hypothetical protein
MSLSSDSTGDTTIPFGKCPPQRNGDRIGDSGQCDNEKPLPPMTKNVTGGGSN